MKKISTCAVVHFHSNRTAGDMGPGSHFLLGLHKNRGLEFPGGKVETLESLDEAIIREVREETGLTVVVDDALTKSDPDEPAYAATDRLIEKYGAVGLLARRIWVRESPTAPDWVCLVRWIDVFAKDDRLPDIGTPEPETHSKWSWLSRPELVLLCSRKQVWAEASAVFQLATGIQV